MIGPDQRSTLLKTGIFFKSRKEVRRLVQEYTYYSDKAGWGRYLPASNSDRRIGMSENTRSKMRAGINHVRRVRE